MSSLLGIQIIPSPYATKPVTVLRAKRVSFVGSHLSGGCRKPRRYWLLRPETVMQPSSYVIGSKMVVHPEILDQLKKAFQHG